MVITMLTAAVVTVAVFGATFALLAVLFRAQVRGLNRTAAVDLLDDWTARQELDPRAVPPANVLAAMVALPSPGARAEWDG